MKRSDVIIPQNIKIGDVIVGFSSTGKASYEEDLVYNSGIGSNGLTLARHGLLHHDYYQKYPECYSPELTESSVFFGQYHLLDKVPNLPISIGEAILSPTRTYAPILLKLLAESRSEIHAIFHNSGGGQTKCLKFGDNLHYIKDNLFSIPPLFQLIQASSNTAWEEMYQVFNMGHRLEIVCSEQFAKQTVIPTSQLYQVDAKIIGHIEKSQFSQKNHITLQSPNGEYKYFSN
jgi:phosphoribosylformylglycinamidine cyclo-ligase